MNFQMLRRVNESRVVRWHPPESDDWIGSDWSNAMAGECGEACNVVKKIRRQDTGARNAGDPPMEALRAMLADEIADTIIYADLLARYYDIDLSEAIASKFNRTSVKFGFPERLVP